MRENHSLPNEAAQARDTGTYQTGASSRSKDSSGLVAALLAATVCLGGIASALGYLNIRLFQRLLEQEQSPMVLSLSEGEPVGQLSGEHSPAAPRLPEEAALELQLRTASDGDQTVMSQQVYEENAVSMATVRCLTDTGAEQSGLALVIGSDGFLLSNAQLLENAETVYVRLSGGQELCAALVGVDTLTDLAVLYVQAEGLTAAEFASSHSLREGDTVYAVSEYDAAAMSAQMAEGEVENTALGFAVGGQQLSFVQTGVRSDFGPLFNACGQVVGINVGRVPRDFCAGLTEGQGLALPSTAVQTLVRQLTETGRAQGRPTFCVQVEEVSRLYQQYWDLPGGLQVTALEGGSHARQHGLQEGDILLTLNGERMLSLRDFYKHLYASTPGQKHEAVVFRGGQQLTVELTTQQTP